MKLNSRIIFIIAILSACIIAINLAVYFQITQKSKTEEQEQEQKQEEVQIDTAMLTENFNNIFDNTIDNQKNSVNVAKVDHTKDLIYTSYVNQERQENTYELDVHIPYLNLNNETANKINTQINELFYKKVLNILASTNEYTIYSVKYKAYINDNLLSLVINATLKEGENPQRVIIKTYNYNLSSTSELSIKEVLEYRGVSEQYVQSRIIETIKKASEDSNQYQELGYSKYLRNIEDSMYQVENTNIYFLGENKAIYIIYPYGNLNYTSEIDLLVI